MSRILLISHTSDLNGAERSLLSFAQGLNQQHFKVSVICPGDGLLTEALRKVSIPFKMMRLLRPQRHPFKLLVFFLLWLPTVLRLSFFIKRYKVDIVYNNTIDGLYAPFAGLLTGTPVVWHVREVKPRSRLGRYFFGCLLKWLPTVTVFNSKATMYAYDQRKSSKWHVVYNGIPIDKLNSPVKNKIEPLIGYVGQMVEHKRPNRFLHIFSRVLSEIPNLRAVMVGDGKLLADLIKQSEKLQLGSSIEFVGYVDSPQVYYSQISILVLTSDREPFGRVVIEAMERGCVVVAANVDGVSEIIEDGINGFLVTPSAINQYVDRILQLFRSDELYYQISAQARISVCMNFSEERYQSELSNLVTRILQRS